MGIHFASIKSPTVFLMGLLYTFLTISLFFSEKKLSENIIEGKGIIFLISLIIALFEVGLLYVFWDKILKKYANKIIDDEDDLNTACLLTALFIPIIIILLNMTIIDNLNKKLDRSKPTKRYLAITDIKTEVSYNSKTHQTKYYNYLMITSWLSNKSFSTQVSAMDSAFADIGDPIEAETKNGFFGFQYYTSLKKINKNLFLPGTKFPLTEEEYNKSKEEYNKSKEPFMNFKDDKAQIIFNKDTNQYEVLINNHNIKIKNIRPSNKQQN